MNYVKDILKLLGVEVGEDFKVKRQGIIIDGLFHIDDYLSVYQYSSDGKYYQSGEVCVYDFLVDECKIVKIPFRPKHDEIYYYFDDGQAYETNWKDVDVDFVYYGVGNCFKTEQEALTKGKEIMEKLRVEYKGEQDVD